MRRLPCLVSFLCLAAIVVAGDELKPNTLSSQEVADGWLLLFDGDTTFGWNIDGTSQVAEGTLVLGGNKQTTAVPTTQFGDCEIRLQYRAEGPATAELTLSRGGSNYPRRLFSPGGEQKGWTDVSYLWDGNKVASQFHSATGYKGQGEATFGSVNGSLRLSVRVPAGSRLLLRNVRIRPLGLKPIFNGKDLTGWKKFPGRKSQFTVTPEGWLNVKNGSGDLQTTDQWADFILQLHCFSNGKHLNSGIFFRCKPGEYQQGYEAQVRNQFTAEPTQEYTLDEYDPESGKKVGSKKAKYQAVDFGTGAIYRRQPARRPMSKDLEWFTMTVIAQGRHLATWVNGVQVTDWTDNRPLQDNARNGCCLNKGAISIQGHDPTTDLSFRNLRIAELPSITK